MIWMPSEDRIRVDRIVFSASEGCRYDRDRRLLWIVECITVDSVRIRISEYYRLVSA